MMPTVASANNRVSTDETENLLLFSVKKEVDLSILKLRSVSKNGKSAVQKEKKSTEFFLRTANRLLENVTNLELSLALLDVLAVAVASHLRELESDPELGGVAQRVVIEKLSAQSKQQLKEIIFKNSKSFGWEWSLALNTILIWLQDDPECQTKFKLSDVSPASSFWSESELQTLQVLAKFSTRCQCFKTFLIRHWYRG